MKKMQAAKSKSDLISLLGLQVTSRGLRKPENAVIDSWVILWDVIWSTKGLVSDYNDSVCAFLLKKLDSDNNNLVFNCYYDFRIKS